MSRQRSKVYSTVSFIAYIIALIVTILILQIFQHAQPALLYIVPLYLIFPLLTIWICKDWTTMFAYEDHASVKKHTCAFYHLDAAFHLNISHFVLDCNKFISVVFDFIRIN